MHTGQITQHIHTGQLTQFVIFLLDTWNDQEMEDFSRKIKNHKPQIMHDQHP